MLTYSFDRPYLVSFGMLFRLADIPGRIPISRNAKQTHIEYGFTIPLLSAANFHVKFISTSASLPKLDYVGAGRPMKWMIGLHVGQNRDMFRL